MMKSILLKIVNISMCIILAIIMYKNILSTPIANQKLRFEGVSERWRYVGGAMYEESLYLRERAFDFLLLANLAPASTERERLLNSAKEAIMMSLERSPSDAFAWTIRATISYLLEDDVDAIDSLIRSWDTSPNNLALAYDRLVVAYSIGLMIGNDIDGAIMADAKMLRNRQNNLWVRFLSLAQSESIDKLLQD